MPRSRNLQRLRTQRPARLSRMNQKRQIHLLKLPLSLTCSHKSFLSCLLSMLWRAAIVTRFRFRAPPVGHFAKTPGGFATVSDIPILKSVCATGCAVSGPMHARTGRCFFSVQHLWSDAGCQAQPGASLPRAPPTERERQCGGCKAPPFVSPCTAHRAGTAGAGQARAPGFGGPIAAPQSTFAVACVARASK